MPQYTRSRFLFSAVGIAVVIALAITLGLSFRKDGREGPRPGGGASVQKVTEPPPVAKPGERENYVVAQSVLLMPGAPKGDGIVQLRFIKKRSESEPTVETRPDMTIKDVAGLVAEQLGSGMGAAEDGLVIRHMGWDPRTLYFSSTDSGIELPDPPSRCKVDLSHKGVLSLAWSNELRRNEHGYLTLAFRSGEVIHVPLEGFEEQECKVDLVEHGLRAVPHYLVVYYSYMTNPYNYTSILNSAPLDVGEVHNPKWGGTPEPTIHHLEEKE